MSLHVTVFLIFVCIPFYGCTIILFVDGHSDCFCFGAIKNNSAMNIFVYVCSVHIYAFVRCFPRRGVTR